MDDTECTGIMLMPEWLARKLVQKQHCLHNKIYLLVALRFYIKPLLLILGYRGVARLYSNSTTFTIPKRMRRFNPWKLIPTIIEGVKCFGDERDVTDCIIGVSYAAATCIVCYYRVQCGLPHFCCSVNRRMSLRQRRVWRASRVLPVDTAS